MKFRSNFLAKKFAPGPLTFCGQCGETIYMAAWSEYFDDQRIRYLWECDDCGYKFETMVRFALPPGRKPAPRAA